MRAKYPAIRDELVKRFGGLTAFIQSPAEGLWKDGDNHTGSDDIVMVEVMVTAVDKSWWASYRKYLQELLAQELIVSRTLSMETT